MTSNVRNLRVLPTSPPTPAKRKRNPLLYFIWIPVALIVGITASGLYYALKVPIPEPRWSCPDNGSSAMLAQYFERCVNRWGLLNRSECLEDARTLYCQKLP